MTDSVLLVRPALQHVPPLAVALAVVLHAAVATVLWWISPLPSDEPDDEPIMVMFDSSPSNVGLQMPERTGPPAPSVAASPPPAPQPDQPERQQALAPPSSVAPAPSEPVPSLPLFEFSVPPATEPPPPPTSHDFVKPNRLPARPVQRFQPRPRQPPAQQRPPAELPATMPSPIPGPLPGDVLPGQGRQRNDYLSRLFRHLEPYRFGTGSHLHGRVVTRVTVARDGRVLDVRLDTPSGSPALDAAEMAAIRKASPFPPLPAAMPGDPVVLVLPINY